VAPRAYNSVRRELASIQTRDAILSAAVELFGSGGYARTTIAEIARRAGVATNTVYTSVGGKPDLVTALIERAPGANVRLPARRMLPLNTHYRAGSVSR
jgi:AcrR family transcriptional regulator